MTTIRELRERGIVLRSLREGIDTLNATGRMVQVSSRVWPSLSWSWAGNADPQRMKRVARAAKSIGRPKALDASKAALVQRMHATGESVSTIAATLGVSRATV
jgi:DNA invertase Pin-like site-specific DNA recombinase